MTLKVLGRNSSINVRKVLWTCAELDLHFEHVESDPELLARNPNAHGAGDPGRRLRAVGVERHLPLPRGQAAARHAAARRSAGARAGGAVDGLAGHRAQQRPGATRSWRWCARAPAHADPAAIAASVESWNEHMRMLDEHFAHGGQFVTGEFFTLADVVLGLSTHRWLLSPIERPHLDARARLLPAPVGAARRFARTSIRSPWFAHDGRRAARHRRAIYGLLGALHARVHACSTCATRGASCRTIRRSSPPCRPRRSA